MAVRQRTKKINSEVSDEYAICKIYRKTPQRPVAGLPTVTSFQEWV